MTTGTTAYVAEDRWEKLDGWVMVEARNTLDYPDEEYRGTQVWSGRHPIAEDIGYRWTPDTVGWGVLFTALIGIVEMTGETEPFWNYQGHGGGCSYHHDVPKKPLQPAGGPLFTHCNAQDGAGHPNMSIPLPGGDVFEVTWDELATKQWRTTMSHELTRDLARTILATVWSAAVERGAVTDMIGVAGDLIHHRGEFAKYGEYPQLESPAEVHEIFLEAFGLGTTS
jgi:hypothetical protein